MKVLPLQCNSHLLTSSGGLVKPAHKLLCFAFGGKAKLYEPSIHLVGQTRLMGFYWSLLLISKLE